MALSTPILITGAAGFIGSYLTRFLISRGIPSNQIIACDDLEALSTRRCTESWRDTGVCTIGIDELLSQLNTLNPQIIFHLGACSRTDETRWDYLVRNNIEYSKTLWDWCTKNKVPFVYASSAATYGDGSLGFDDNMSIEAMKKLKPLNLYGKSKWLFDIWALESAQSGNHPVGFWGLKFFNVYGPGEEHKTSQASVVYHASQQLKEKGQITLFESHNQEFKHGEQMRDFICVDDVAKVCEWIGNHKPPSGIYNVGTGRAQTFIDLANAVFEELKTPKNLKFTPTPMHLREHYQYFTEAKMDKLLAAGYPNSFLNLSQGTRLSLQT